MPGALPRDPINTKEQCFVPRPGYRLDVDFLRAGGVRFRLAGDLFFAGGFDTDVPPPELSAPRSC